MDKAGSAVATGLRGVVAAASSISDVNGEKGELIYQGINIHDLATKSTFEEVVFLLWNGRLPKRAELAELKKNLGIVRNPRMGPWPNRILPEKGRANGYATHC